jgi:hypothetical protein
MKIEAPQGRSKGANATLQLPPGNVALNCLTSHRTRWEPPASAGGGALQRSGKRFALIPRFSAGPWRQFANLVTANSANTARTGKVFRGSELQLPPGNVALSCLTSRRTRWEPPASAGGGALQRSGKRFALIPRFSAGPWRRFANLVRANPANTARTGKVLRGSELQLRHNSRREAPTARGAFPASFLSSPPRKRSTGSAEEAKFPSCAVSPSVQPQASSLSVFPPFSSTISRSNDSTHADEGKRTQPIENKQSPYARRDTKLRSGARQKSALFAPQFPASHSPSPGPGKP